ncbi:hypothetical protein BJ508DRAFT_359640 [Ascobolus immersus RN42]|uniref:Uncharacterized protein n=1 Tax=Ascobolus immersus RN42 TaxID=1160509 RepID=A0A3N4IKA7_ASCIM|nr:hypothetical protein BJ508DRAFT_359640 [Ascobolus immersus RN42]
MSKNAADELARDDTLKQSETPSSELSETAYGDDWYESDRSDDPDVHEIIKNHFSDLPSDSIRFNPSESWEHQTDPDVDNLFYEYLGFCGYGEREFHDNFRSIIEESLLFYVQKLYPYYASLSDDSLFAHRLSCTGRADYEFEDSISCDLISMIMCLGQRYLGSHRISIAQRASCGLMRREQFMLLEISFRKQIDQLSVLLNYNEKNVDMDEFLLLREMDRVMRRNKEFLLLFVGNERFRSERLELLLLKYLAEEGVNWDVVRGLEEAQRYKENEAYETFERKRRLKIEYYSEPPERYLLENFEEYCERKGWGVL